MAEEREEVGELLQLCIECVEALSTANLSALESRLGAMAKAVQPLLHVANAKMRSDCIHLIGLLGTKVLAVEPLSDATSASLIDFVLDSSETAAKLVCIH